MKILFTKSDTVVSRLIRWGLDEPVSHVALVFGDTLVVHSSVWGVYIESLEGFAKENETVYSLEFREPANLSRQIIAASYNTHYDIPAFTYLAWRALLKKCFKKPFPKKNKLGVNHAYICTEMVSYLETLPEVGEKIKGVDLEMVSPYQLYLLLK